MILAYCKRMPDQRKYMQSRDYLEGWGAYHPHVKIISDLTMGLLGMGEIARPVARIAQAFNMRIVYWDIVRFPDLEKQYGLTFMDWDDLFRDADVLSVQLALNEKTEGIIGSREFELMKPTSLFINTARGKLVDQDALVSALQSNSIGGAALDVFAEEPLPGDSPLHALHDNGSHSLILTPHSAAQGPWTWIRDSQEIWFNVLRALNDEPVKHLVEASIK
jgi:phosphoglycerate dehydrogenase-like enzyme